MTLRDAKLTSMVYLNFRRKSSKFAPPVPRSTHRVSETLAKLNKRLTETQCVPNDIVYASNPSPFSAHLR